MRLFGSSHAADTETFPVTLTDEEWRAKLSPAQYQVLRKHSTERAGTSPLNAEKRHGKFVCAGCGQDLFASDTKFESGTGWPSFYQPLEGGVGTTEDRGQYTVLRIPNWQIVEGLRRIDEEKPKEPRVTPGDGVQDGVGFVIDNPEYLFVLLKPRPFTDADRLVIAYETSLKRGSLGSAASYPNFADWREQNNVFDKMASYHNSDFVLTGEGWSII